jgi:hypothetical protein
VDRLAAFAGSVMIALATAPASRASRPNAPPASVPAQRRDTSRGAPRRRIQRLAAERRAGCAGLDLGAARDRGGIEGLAADRTTGIGPGAAARHVEGRDTSPAWKRLTLRGGPLIAAEAVASGGMLDAPPASRRGP